MCFAMKYKSGGGEWTKKAEHDLQNETFVKFMQGFQLFFQWIHNSLNVLIICLSNSGTIIEAGGFPKVKLGYFHL